MEKTLTAIAAGIWVAPLAALGAAVVCYHLLNDGVGNDRRIAESMLSFLITLVAALVGFAAAFFAVRTLVPDQLLRYVRIVDAVAILALLITAFVAWKNTWTHPAPQYAGFRGVLEVEVRTPKHLLANQNAAGHIIVFINDGEGDVTTHNQQIR